jgi:FAD/FMN-containing dehydrogenase
MRTVHGLRCVNGGEEVGVERAPGTRPRIAPRARSCFRIHVAIVRLSAPRDTGALATIDGKFLMFAVGLSMTPEMGAAVKAHVEVVQTALARWDSGRMYLNFAEKRERGERFFGDATYRRLQAVKAAVDPDDVFRSNHPIRLPAAEARKAA